MTDSNQIYLVLEKPIGYMVFEHVYYTDDKLVIMDLLEKVRNNGRQIRIFYFPQMKEIVNYRAKFNPDEGKKKSENN